MSDRPDSLVANLAARARARDDEARALEVIAEPPSAALRDDIFAALDAQASREKAQSAHHTPRKPARVIALRWAAALVPLAAAAAFAFHVGLSRGDGEPATEYAIEVAGHIAVERAASDATRSTLQARPGAIQEVVLRPRQGVAMPVEARVLGVFARGIVPLDAAAEVTERGVVRFTVRGDALRGATEARVVIAPPSRMAEAIDRATTSAAPRVPNVTVVTIAVESDAAR